MKKSELQRLISEILEGQQQDVKAGDILRHKSSFKQLKVIGKIKEDGDTILICSATWSPSRLRVNLNDVGVDYDVVTNEINEGQRKQITNSKTILTEGVDEDKSKTFKHTHNISRGQWNQLYVNNRHNFDIEKAMEDMFTDKNQMFLIYTKDEKPEHIATYDVDNGQLYSDIPGKYMEDFVKGMLELEDVEYVTEDDYYEPQKRQINQKDEVEKIVGDYLKMSGGEGSENFYVRGNGTDIEYTTIPYTDKHGFKHKAGTMSKEDWEEVIDNLRIELEKNGYENFELDWISPTGFRMSQNNELTEVSSLKQETWTKSDIRDLLYLIGQDYIVYSNDIDTGNAAGDWGNIKFYPQSDKEIRLEFETPAVAQKAFDIFSSSITNPYEFESRFDIMPTTIMVKFTDNESLEESETMTTTDIWTNEEIENFLTSINQTQIIPNKHHDGTGISYGEYGTITYDRIFNTLYLEFGNKEKKDLFAKTAKIPSHYEISRRSDIMPMTIMIQVKK